MKQRPKKEDVMRRFLCLVLVFCLAMPCGLAGEAYTVTEDGEIKDAKARYEMQARWMIQAMSPHEKVCQLIITTPEAVSGRDVVTSADASFLEAFARTPVGGFIYYARNLVTREQTIEMLADISAFAREKGMTIVPFHAVDEEGGDVARVAYRLNTRRFPDARALGKEMDALHAYDMGETLAFDLLALGFHVNFAPVADVSGGADAAIGNRSYGEEPELVAALSSAVARGMQDHGLIAAMKHFPGHGTLRGNVHLARAVDSRPLEAFRQSDFIPFKAGVDIDIGMIMMSDMVMGAISQAPACLSRDVVMLLREEIGYDGVIITDALRMDAITESYSSAEAALMAIEAGCDMILLPNDLNSAVSALEKAVESGRISEERIEESLMRIIRLKLQYGVY